MIKPQITKGCLIIAFAFLDLSRFLLAFAGSSKGSWDRAGEWHGGKRGSRGQPSKNRAEPQPDQMATIDGPSYRLQPFHQCDGPRLVACLFVPLRPTVELAEYRMTIVPPTNCLVIGPSSSSLAVAVQARRPMPPRLGRQRSQAVIKLNRLREPCMGC